MNIQGINLELLSELEIPEYHDYFVASQLNKGFSFQMRALRSSQDLTQKQLAELSGTKQSVISRTETNGVSNLSVKTLLKLASAFNVGLVLRFVSLEHLLDWKNPISLEELAPKKSTDVIDSLKKAVKNKVSENKPTKTTTATKIYKFPVKKVFEPLPKPKQTELPFGLFPVPNDRAEQLTKFRQPTNQLRPSVRSYQTKSIAK